LKTLSRFVAKFTSLIVAVLSCFDRVLFNLLRSDHTAVDPTEGARQSPMLSSA
jgi:hypothetical protein